MPQDAKALVKLKGAGDELLFAGTHNRGPLKLFKSAKKANVQLLRQDDDHLIIHFRNGQRRKEELYYGTSFLSQSSRCVNVNQSVHSIEVVNNKGARRVINP